MGRSEPTATPPDRPALPPRAARAATALDALVPGLRFMIGLVIAALVIAGLYFGRSILVPLALAFLLSFVLEPLVARLKRIGVPGMAAVLSVVLATLLVLGAGATLVANEARVLSAQLPSYQNTIRKKLRGLREEMRAPGMFDGAKRTLDIVQREVDAATTPPRGAPAAVQKVQVLPPPQSPSQQAMAALDAVGGPLADAALVLVFVIFILLDRVDLRDRLLRLWGRDLHRATDAMDEAGGRISRYLTMQLLVNVTYGIPLAAGLWFIGVPGALLWGALAAVMRFVPYVGPLISSVFPVALAFAVDPGWSLVLWTVGLIAVLEIISNNVIEPWLYGASTGLSALSLIVAATFWTSLWGPVGLVMSTPLTVCLLVVGRYLPQLAFLNVLLGSQPALDEPTRIYQRLLADAAEEAIELSARQIEARQGSVQTFYAEIGLPVLRMAVGDHAHAATPQHRLRVVEGMDELLDDLAEQYPPGAAPATGALPGVACIGGKWEMDHLAARMLAHALQLQGCPVQVGAGGAHLAEQLQALALDEARVVCVVWLAPDPVAAARYFCRRLKRRWPHVQVVLALWNAPDDLLDAQAREHLGADAVATSLEEAVMRITQMQGASTSEEYEPARVPPGDADRVAALQASGALRSAALAAASQGAAQRAADIFDMPVAMVSLMDADTQHPCGMHGGEGGSLPRALSPCAHVVASAQPLVVPDIARDARFAGNPLLRERGLRFYAGVPLRGGKGHVLGTLCLMDTEPRPFDAREARLLQAMADDLMAGWRGARDADQAGASTSDAPVPPSATVGQAVP